MFLQRGLKRGSAFAVCAGALFAGGGVHATQGEKAAAPATITIAPNFHIASFDMVGGKIVLHVRMNGKNVGNMVLDTGANTIISPQAAAALGLKLEPYKEAGPNSKYGEIKTLAIGNATLHDVSVEVTRIPVIEAWNKAHPDAHVCGLLGRDGVDKWAVGLDFVSHTLGLWPGGKLPPEQARSFNNFVHLPGEAPDVTHVVRPGEMEMFNDKPIVNPPLTFPQPQALPLYTKEEDGYYLVRVGLEGAQREMVLDTGSEGSTVSSEVGAKFHPLFGYHSQVETLEGTGEGLTEMLRSLTLGQATFDFCPVTVMQASQPKPAAKKGEAPVGSEAVLGMDVLANCRVILDFPGKMLYVSPYAGHNHTPSRLLQRLGVFASPTTQERSHYQVYVVYPGYPAAQAGIKVADELLDVNGTPAKSWFADPNRMLGDKAFTLRVRRKDNKEPLTFTLPLPAA